MLLATFVLPPQPLRQWVLTLPFELRAPVAYQPGLMRAVARVFADSLLRWYACRQGAEHLPAAYRDQLLAEHHRRLFAEPCLAEIAQRTFLLDGECFAEEEAAHLEALAAAHARTRVLGVTRQGPAGVERAS